MTICTFYSGEESRQAVNKMVADTVKMPPLRPLRLKSSSYMSKPKGRELVLASHTGDTTTPAPTSELQGERDVPPVSTTTATFNKDPMVGPFREPQGFTDLHRRNHVYRRRRIDTSIKLAPTEARGCTRDLSGSSLKRRGHINRSLLSRTRVDSDSPIPRQHLVSTSAPHVTKALVGPNGKSVNRTSIVDWLEQFGVVRNEFADLMFVDEFSSAHHVALDSPPSSPETTPPLTPTLRPILLDEDAKSTLFDCSQHDVMGTVLGLSCLEVAIHDVNNTVAIS